MASGVSKSMSLCPDMALEEGPAYLLLGTVAVQAQLMDFTDGNLGVQCINVPDAKTWRCRPSPPVNTAASTHACAWTQGRGVCEQCGIVTKLSIARIDDALPAAAAMSNQTYSVEVRASSSSAQHCMQHDDALKSPLPPALAEPKPCPTFAWHADHGGSAGEAGWAEEAIKANKASILSAVSTTGALVSAHLRFTPKTAAASKAMAARACCNG